MPITKAVVPVAGLGTRLYPAARAVKKELFPVVDRDGTVKPVIQLIVEEACVSGIEQVCLIVRPGDEAVFRRYFTETLPADVEARLADSDLARAVERVLELGRHVDYVVQPQPEGFGHAVFCARSWVGDAPFLLMLGDHLSRSETATSCARQLLDTFDRLGRSVVAVKRTPEEWLHLFGTIGGSPLADMPRVYRVTAFAEKPSVADARARLRIDGLEAGAYLCFFGQYALTPGIFEGLQFAIQHDVREQREIQLTSVLERVRQAEGGYAYEMQGERYDVGVPDGYARTVVAFART